MLETIKNSKFFSRKFILAAVADIAGIATLLTASSDNTIKTVAAIAMIVCSTTSYIMGESKVDAASAAKNILTSAEALIDILEAYNKAKGIEDNSKATDTKEV